MTMLSMVEIKALNDHDLSERLDSAKQELMKLREKVATRQQNDTSQMRMVKRDIARLLTAQSQRALARADQKAGVGQVGKLPERTEEKTA
jgi:large subunit ribosomal protein L29